MLFMKAALENSMLINSIYLQSTPWKVGARWNQVIYTSQQLYPLGFSDSLIDWLSLLRTCLNIAVVHPFLITRFPLVADNWVRIYEGMAGEAIEAIVVYTECTWLPQHHMLG